MQFPRVTHIHLRDHITTPRGLLNKNYIPKDLKMRLREDLRCVEIKKADWGNITVFVPMEMIAGFSLETDPAAPVPAEEPKKKK